MNEDEYTGAHQHPSDPTVVEFVAYERRDGSGWNVYVFKPPGSCPELEATRTDEFHLFIQRIADLNELDGVVAETERRLGDGYRLVPYYRETGTRRAIGRIHDYLKRNGAHDMSVRGLPGDEWELWLRKKDVTLARQIAPANIA